jgi:hypothetical protein
VVAAHTRGVANVEGRAQQIRAAARDWVEFWDGHLDLDALAWETAELLADLTAADARVERATETTRRYWEQLWGDDPVLLSVPGMGPLTAPTVLRLAFYQAANVARTHDPQLADFYRRLMVERGHCHTKANCAVARKLVARTWATIVSGASYELRDLNGTPITRREATKLAAALAVPDDIRRRTRAHSAATHRAPLTR